jgi:hypothetical protein
VDEAARAEIAKLPNVLEVAPEIRVMTDVSYQDQSYPTFMGSLSPSAKQSESFDTMQGAYFSSPNAKEAILQKDFAARLEKNPKDIIGKEITLRYAQRQAADSSDSTNNSLPISFSVVRKEQALKVVGIIDEEPFGGMRLPCPCLHSHRHRRLS